MMTLLSYGGYGGEFNFLWQQGVPYGKLLL